MAHKLQVASFLLVCNAACHYNKPVLSLTRAQKCTRLSPFVQNDIVQTELYLEKKKKNNFSE